MATDLVSSLGRSGRDALALSQGSNDPETAVCRVSLGTATDRREDEIDAERELPAKSRVSEPVGHSSDSRTVSTGTSEDRTTRSVTDPRR